MQFCGFEVTNADGLFGVASHLTRAGATTEPWHDHVESALLPFEELAFARSDWHGEINRALVMGACGPYPGLREPVLNLLQTAAGSLFAVAALEIADRMRTGGAGARTRFDDIADRIVQREALLAARPATVPLPTARGGMDTLHPSDAASLQAAARATLAAPAPPGSHVWAWLRRLQLMAPWAAPLVPGLVMTLGSRDDPAAWKAAVAFAYIEGDRRLLLPWLTAEVAAPGPFHAEAVAPLALVAAQTPSYVPFTPGAECATWGDVLRRALEGAQDELQTAPEPRAHAEGP